ncbi:MAG: hypothetical protein JW801_02635, partial [Bacteroidales bacterium]|nr:hypothetical protein [Bacteroidales bacterium]
LVPEGKIATLPQGWMVGQVADNFGEDIAQKNFNCLVRLDVKAQQREEESYVPIPDFYRFDSIPEVLERNRTRIQNDIRAIQLSNPDQEKKENKAGKPEPKIKHKKQTT